MKTNHFFISLRDKDKPLGIGGVENLIRTLGKLLVFKASHVQTNWQLAIDRNARRAGALLGHKRIDTI